MDGCGDSQLFHPRQFWRGDPVDVSQNPSQVLDRMILINSFDLIQESADSIFQFRVHVKRQPIPGDLGRNAPPKSELVRFRIRFDQEHRVMQRAIDAFAEKDVIQVVVALKQFHPPNLRQGPLDLFLVVPVATPSIQNTRTLSFP